MEDTNLFFRYGIALLMGILAGLQREFAFAAEDDGELAVGVRTFALMGLTGCTGALLSDQLGSPWPLASVITAVGALLTVSHFAEARKRRSGLTTEVSAILTMLVGALAFWNYLQLAVALGVAMTVLLSVKIELHRFARQITLQDVYATLKLAVISAIVLPVLPDKAYGPPPFDVLNPFQIWLLVVFISGMNFIGYVLIKTVGTRRGIELTGLFGGMASSTAATLSLTHRSRKDHLAKSFALAILLAWIVMYVRALIQTAVVNMELFKEIWLPSLAPMAAGLIYCVWLFKREKKKEEEDQGLAFSNPFELGPAIKFGLIFTLVLLISKAAQVHIGDAGIYISSFVSGLADVDAIVLSMAQLSSRPEGIDIATAARAVILAAVANTLTKGGIALFIGSSGLRRSILPGFALMVISGVAVIFLI
ncbi:MAG: MgtC/SapB family protein [Thermodesulfobacteriota bacterium]